MDEILDARAEGFREGVNSSRYDFDRGRKLGRAEGFRGGFALGIVVMAAVLAFLLFT